MADGYNGWTNYETWNFNRWIDNDEESESYWRKTAEETLKDCDGDRDAAKQQLAECLKNETEENAPKLDNGFYSDVLSAAISEVDWYEIAEHWIDDIEEEEEDEQLAE